MQLSSYHSLFSYSSRKQLSCIINMAFPLFLTCFSLLPLVLSAPSKYTPNDPNTQLLGKAAGVPGIDKTFDYLVRGQRSHAFRPTRRLTTDQIVGGGTAGLTVAARLAENPNLAVAVIEAGGFYEIENGNTSVVPGYDVTYAYPRAGVTPPVDWGLTTEPQAVCSTSASLEEEVVIF